MLIVGVTAYELKRVLEQAVGELSISRHSGAQYGRTGETFGKAIQAGIRRCKVTPFFVTFYSSSIPLFALAWAVVPKWSETFYERPVMALPLGQGLALVKGRWYAWNIYSNF